MTNDDDYLPRTGKCPSCGYVTDTIGVMLGEPGGGPEPGNLSICLKCGHISVFAEDLSLRDPTAAERNEIDADPEFRALERKRREVMNKAKQ